jgi:hypothetical protein
MANDLGTLYYPIGNSADIVFNKERLAVALNKMFLQCCGVVYGIKFYLRSVIGFMG